MRPRDRETMCKNSHCRNTLSSLVSKNVRYCSTCQQHIRQYRELFPHACSADIFFLVENGFVNLATGARMCGLHISTLHSHIQNRKLESEKRGTATIIQESHLVFYQSRNLGLVPVGKAAKKIGLSCSRLWYLIKLGLVRFQRNAIGLTCVRERDLKEISDIHSKLKATEKIRRSRASCSRPEKDELSTSEISQILDYWDKLAVCYLLRRKLLKGRKRDRKWYVKKEDFLDFCQKVVSGEIKTYLVTRNNAQKYIDSLAAG